MNPDELKQYFPHASHSTLRRNSGSGQAGVLHSSAGPVAKLEQDSVDGAVGAVRVQATTGKRFLVRVKATRTRLLDEDNLCEKFHVDLLRYASGGAFGDSPATTKIEVSQQKAQAGEPEEVLIEVYEV